ncbi:MAG: phospholipase D-like domain-containing protein, partial [Acholeplasma sp.]|nr:phospholipase D-like domain-containing protein [Acholeplasma sp.]
MRKIVKLLTSKVLILGLLILLQLIFLFFFVHKLANDDLIGVYVHFVFIAASVLIVLHIVASNENPSYKIAWLIPVLAFPVFGTFFYILYHQNNVTNRSIRKYSSITKKRSDLLQGHPNYSKFKETNYYNANGWRDYKNTSSLLLDSGQIKLEHLLRDLKKAEKFIFMEYFIISKGKMLDEILDVLIERAHAGVEIKIIYDDFGSADRLPFNFRNKMSALGIETLPFNRMRPHINFSMNYRDHRKVIVIDNKIGYTGGINIGDEYANYYERFGKWHDASIRIEGNAVWSLTLLFLENWNFSTSKKQQVSFLDYYYSHSVESNDIVVPFGDSPMENKQLARNSFLYLINEAKEEILITTPYLIFDNELLTALKLAAASGVKVKIVIP